MITVLALAFGAVAALPFVYVARRELVAARLCTAGTPDLVGSRPRRRIARTVGRVPVVAIVVRVAGAPRRRRRTRRDDAALRRELPVVIDLVSVAVSAGCTPFHAVDHAARFGPPRSGDALRGVTQACARGGSLDEALRDLARTAPLLRPLAEALRTTARLGTPAAPALARLAGEVRADVRRRAEASARTVPVRLCFPLVLCVLPAFALLTVVPVVLAGLRP